MCSTDMYIFYDNLCLTFPTFLRRNFIVGLGLSLGMKNVFSQCVIYHQKFKSLENLSEQYESMCLTDVCPSSLLQSQSTIDCSNTLTVFFTTRWYFATFTFAADERHSKIVSTCSFTSSVFMVIVAVLSLYCDWIHLLDNYYARSPKFSSLKWVLCQNIWMAGERSKLDQIGFYNSLVKKDLGLWRRQKQYFESCKHKVGCSKTITRIRFIVCSSCYWKERFAFPLLFSKPHK